MKEVYDSRHLDVKVDLSLLSVKNLKNEAIKPVANTFLSTYLYNYEEVEEIISNSHGKDLDPDTANLAYGSPHSFSFDERGKYEPSCNPTIGQT